MLTLVSWNVAGWSTTAQNLRSAFGSIAAFLNATNADIVCVQEAKILWTKLNSDAQQSGASDGGTYPLAGWDSFWSCCATKAFNGVTTFVRAGMTERAEDRFLGDAELDKEGRCVVTWHSSCIVVNVYVPYSGYDPSRADIKQRFLSALRRAMKRIRAEEQKLRPNPRPVLLCGDLNLTWRTRDCHFMKRRLALELITHFVSLRSVSPESSFWQEPVVAAALAAFRVVAPAMAQILENRVYDEESKTVGKDAKPDPNGAPMTSVTNLSSLEASSAEISRLCTRLRTLNPQQTKASASYDEACSSPLLEYTEFWVDQLAKQNGAVTNAYNAHVYLLAELFGLPSHRDSTFLRTQLMDEDGLEDLFLATGGDAAYAQPYTCWHQYKNRRSENEGSRIDGIWTDAGRLSSAAGAPVLRPHDGTTAANTASHSPPPESPSSNLHVRLNAAFDVLRDTLSAAFRTRHSLDDSWNVVSGALSARWFQERTELQSPVTFLSLFNGEVRAVEVRRAMASGLYPQAPMEGTGMPPLSPAMARHGLIDLHAAQQLVVAAAATATEPHTVSGLLNMAPQLSDHIGVFVVTSALAPLQAYDPKQLKNMSCKYRRQSVSLKDMFQRKTSGGPPPLSAPPTANGAEAVRFEEGPPKQQPQIPQQESKKRERDDEIIIE